MGFYLYLLLEAFLQADAAVEHQMFGTGVLVIQAEVAQTHELEGRSGLALLLGLLVSLSLGLDTGLHLAALQDFQRVGIQAINEVLIGAVRSLVGE